MFKRWILQNNLMLPLEGTFIQSFLSTISWSRWSPFLPSFKIILLPFYSITAPSLQLGPQFYHPVSSEYLTLQYRNWLHRLKVCAEVRTSSARSAREWALASSNSASAASWWWIALKSSSRVSTRKRKNAVCADTVAPKVLSPCRCQCLQILTTMTEKFGGLPRSNPCPSQFVDSKPWSLRRVPTVILVVKMRANHHLGHHLLKNTNYIAVFRLRCSQTQTKRWIL